MARVQWVHERLLRWSSWVKGGGAGRSQGVGGYDAAWTLRGAAASASDGLWTASVPYDALEASETEAAVVALPPELAKIVKAVYVDMMGMTLASQARRLRMSDQTLRARLEQADARLVLWIEAKQGQREGRAPGPALPAHRLGNDLMPLPVSQAVRVVTVGEHVVRVSRVVRVADID